MNSQNIEELLESFVSCDSCFPLRLKGKFLANGKMKKF